MFVRFHAFSYHDKTFLFRNEILLLLVLNCDTHILLKYSYEPNRLRVAVSELEIRRFLSVH